MKLIGLKYQKMALKNIVRKDDFDKNPFSQIHV